MTREGFDKAILYHKQQQSCAETIKNYENALETMRNMPFAKELDISLERGQRTYITVSDLREFIETKIERIKDEIAEINKKIEEL